MIHDQNRKPCRTHSFSRTQHGPRATGHGPRATGIVMAALALAGYTCQLQAMDFEVAQIVPLSGTMAHVGKEINAITQATLLDFNQSNQGVRFVLKTYDDGYVKEASATYALRASNTAQALLSCFGTTSCLAQQRISAETHVPLIGPIAGAPQLRGKQAYTVYPVRASAAQEVARLFSFADTSGMHTIGILIQDDGFGRAYAAELDKTAALYSHINVVRVFIKPNAPDYETAVATMQAGKPVAVTLLAANAAHSSAFLKTWRRSQTLPFVLNFAGQASANFSNAIKNLTSTVAFVTVTPSPWENKYHVQRDYRRIAEAAGIPPSYLGFESYLNARTLIEAVTRSKASNKTELIRWLNAGTQIDLGGYSLDWNGERQGSVFTDLSLLLPNGKYKH